MSEQADLAQAARQPPCPGLPAAHP
jgi:hypothetical protein